MGPHFILDQQKIEKVQHRTTHLVSTLKELLYAEHLSSLNLPSLHYRCWRGDLILVYKLINNYFSTYLSSLFTLSSLHTRGHQFKLFKHHMRLQYFFSNRVINDWNNLSSHIVNVESLNSFKTILSNFRFSYV